MRAIIGTVIAAALFAGCAGGGQVAAGPTQTPHQNQILEPDPTDAPEATAAPVTRPATYKALTKREWQKVVKSPDKYVGKGYKLWACIWQFDAATGDDGFLGNASYKKQTYWSLDGDNAAFTGSASILSDYVEGDIVTMSVVTLGSYSYDTQAGGNTTVPSFEVVKIKRQKGSCA